jgi:hypothetical protein
VGAGGAVSLNHSVLYSTLLGAIFGAVVGGLFVGWRLHAMGEIWRWQGQQGGWQGVLNAYPELRYALAFIIGICLLAGVGAGAFLGWATHHRPKDLT